MRLTRHQNARRVRLAAFGTGFLAATLGALFMAMLPGSSVAAPAIAPTNTGEPRISGTPRVGEVLRTTRGSWTGTEPITFEFQWRRCQGRGEPDASDCARITNAENASYVLREADSGFRIRSRVTATNDDGSASAASNPTAVVTSARPTNTALPTISGNTVVDTRATATDGWVTLPLVPNRFFPQPRDNFNVQFFVKAYRAGDPPLGGIAGYRLPPGGRAARS